MDPRLTNKLNVIRDFYLSITWIYGSIKLCQRLTELRILCLLQDGYWLHNYLLSSAYKVLDVT